jgi:hypothetical protein
MGAAPEALSNDCRIYSATAPPSVTCDERSGMINLSKRLANLERTCRTTRDVQDPVTAHSFLAQVEERMRRTRESFPEAAQALVARLKDDELEALLLEAETPKGVLANDGRA